MLSAYYGHIPDGRLKRLPYLGYCLLLTVIGILIAFGVGAAMGVSEQAIGGGLEQTQAQLSDRLGGAAIVLLVVIGLALLFAKLNVHAKRIRDMGLPGWPGVAGILGIGIIFAAFISEGAAGVFNLLMFLALLVVPSDAFGRAAAANA